MTRGQVWWAQLARPIGSEPGFSRPAVVIQSNRFNRSRISTVIVAAITGNLRLRDAPGNVYLARDTAGLERASVINVSQLATLDRRRLVKLLGSLTAAKLRELDDGLRRVLEL
jgi:mRNA interferase MazF